jgi:hypothetical protein
VKRQELLGACVLLFGALLCWPLLSIPNRPLRVVGVPALVLYLFIVWGAIVGVLVWAALRGRGDDTT